MPIRVDDHWHYEGTEASRERRVYRDALLIGRVRRWSATEGGNLWRELFTVERWRDGAFVPAGGEQPNFEEALHRLVFYDAAN